MATMLRVEGTTEPIAPAGPNWSVRELQTLVGGYIEVLRTIDGKYLVVDEEGKLKKKPLNIQATRLYLHGRHDPIVGTALLFDTKEEMDGPAEEDDEDEAIEAS
jgi:Domain of unknown function (DUF3846)